MKKNIFQLGFLFLLLIFTSSCVGLGFQESRSKDSLGVSYTRGWSIFPSHETARDRAKANVDNSRAAINYAIAQRIASGQPLNMLKAGGFHNLGSRPIYVEHPETKEKIMIPAKEYGIIYTREIPRHVKMVIGGKEYRERVYSTEMTMEGTKIQYGADINE